ncbi:MAG TPA: agmatinase [Ktedonobacterales bacterium]|nr:agmatinase [Ktedonobacterales bacterium]
MNNQRHSSEPAQQFGDPPEAWGKLETAAAVIIPAPLEYTVCYGEGTAQGPAAIIAASTQMELYDEALDWIPMSAGIATQPALTFAGLSQEAALQATEQAVADVLARGQLPVTLGGEHSLTPACLRAVQQHRNDKPLGLISFDAHADMRASYEGTPLSHACAMRRALEIPGIRALELGIRSISPEEVADIRETRPPLEIVWAHQFAEMRLGALLEQLPPRVYVTVDLDAFDPSCMPAVGTPEPGGIGWYEFLRAFQLIAEQKEIVGLDVVELAPIAGLSHPDFFAAKLVYKMLGYIFHQRRPSR